MDTIIVILIVLEMIVVNLFVCDICSTKAYSKVKTAIVLNLYTLVILVISYNLLKQTSGFGNGNGLFALIGFIYLIPLKILYKESIKRIVMVICSSWIYTMMVFALAVHTSNLFNEIYFFRNTLIIQTIIYLLSLKIFINFIRKKFLYVLKNISPKINTNLQYISLTWFASIIIINLSFVYTEVNILKIVCLIILVINAVFSYIFIFNLVESFKNIEKLEGMIYIDKLTKIKNRSGMFNDANTFIENKTPFYVIYMDLDFFKSINDNYGHIVGDEYLKIFAQTISNILQNEGCIYRIAGDEFVCIYTGEDKNLFINRVKSYQWNNVYKEVSFLGCSIGYSKYPEDSELMEKLLVIADKEMYKCKRQNHRKV